MKCKKSKLYWFFLYLTRYPSPYGGGALYPRPSPSAGGAHLYPDRYGGGYNDYYNYKLDNMHRDRIYELDRYPPGVGDPYLDPGRYDGADDDRFNSRYGPSGGRLNNRFGGSTFTISGTGTRYPSRPEYDDRDADRRFFFRPGRRPVGTFFCCFPGCLGLVIGQK